MTTGEMAIAVSPSLDQEVRDDYPFDFALCYSFHGVHGNWRVSVSGADICSHDNCSNS